MVAAASQPNLRGNGVLLSLPPPPPILVRMGKMDPKRATPAFLKSLRDLQAKLQHELGQLKSTLRSPMFGSENFEQGIALFDHYNGQSKAIAAFFEARATIPQKR